MACYCEKRPLSLLELCMLTIHTSKHKNMAFINALLISGLQTSLAFAQTTQTEITGGAGGGAFNTDCGHNHVLVGLTGKAGAYIDQMTARSVLKLIQVVNGYELLLTVEPGYYPSVSTPRPARGLIGRSGSHIDALGLIYPISQTSIMGGAGGADDIEANCGQNSVLVGFDGASGAYISIVLRRNVSKLMPMETG